MERRYFLLLILIALPYVNAGSVGISPAYFVEHFEPNMEKSFKFQAFNSNPNEGIGIQLEGNLEKYASISTNYLQGSGLFEVDLKLPEKLDRPGTHSLYVKVFESKNESADISAIGGIAAIRVPIKILVPYPGKYTESVLKVNNINEGEDARYELDIQNLGTENVTIDALIEVFKINKNGEKMLTQQVNDMFLESKNVLNVVDELDTNEFEPGEYHATATMSYGKTETVNTTFRVGEFLVDIIDYDYLFERDKINQFNIKIENKWNTKIESVFGEVTITDEGEVISSFRTVSLDTNPWEIKNITGFFDAEDLDSGRYLANINLFYAGSKTNKLVAIYIQDPPKEREYLRYVLMIVAVLSIIIIAGFALLIIKIKKLREQLKASGKKK